MKFPEHIRMIIVHNEHKNYYKTIKDYIDDKNELYRFNDDEMNNRCILNDQIWEIQFYPITPIYFKHVYADTFEEALKLANNIKV